MRIIGAMCLLVAASVAAFGAWCAKPRGKKAQQPQRPPGVQMETTIGDCTITLITPTEERGIEILTHLALAIHANAEAAEAFELINTPPVTELN